MSLVLAVVSRAHELFEKYGSIRAELGKAVRREVLPDVARHGSACAQAS